MAGSESLDDTDAADRLFYECRRAGPCLLQTTRARVIALRVGPGGNADEREREQHQERKPYIEHQHHCRDGDHCERIADRVADRVHHPRDVLRIRRGAAHQLARADTVVVRGVEPKRVREDRIAHACVGRGAVADREDVAHPSRDDLEQADSEQGE